MTVVKKPIGNLSKLGGLVVLAGAVAAALAGCGESEPKRGVRGEACTSTDDCGSGLVCLNFECSEKSFSIEATGKECVSIACREADDCCALPPCTGFDCDDGECIETCSGDADCLGQSCVGGRCVDCSSDDDCIAGQCIDNQCVGGCERTADCAYFEECQDGLCVHVGCKTDRECIAATRKTRARCNDGTCEVPCDSDVECSGGDGSGAKVCVDGLCQDIGCETDLDCRGELLPGFIDVECRAAK